MPTRLVTPEDILKYPELIHKGISVNMNHDFPEEETKVEDAENPAEEIKQKVKSAPKKAAKKAIKKSAPKKTKSKSKK